MVLCSGRRTSIKKERKKKDLDQGKKKVFKPHVVYICSSTIGSSMLFPDAGYNIAFVTTLVSDALFS